MKKYFVNASICRFYELFDKYTNFYNKETGKTLYQKHFAN